MSSTSKKKWLNKVSKSTKKTSKGSWDWKNRKWKKKVTAPEKFFTKKNLGILVMTEEKLEEVHKICKSQAGDNEYQIHYHSMTMECRIEEEKVFFTIPTVFYSFKQTVSSASIEYHLDDLSKAKNQTKELHDKVMAQLYPIEEYLKTLANEDGKPLFESIKMLSINDNSMHRHPGRFGFSPTDLDNSPEEPGVVYRQKKATNYPQMDSVMYFGLSTSEIYTSEMRIVNVKPSNEDDGIEGKYTEIPTVTIFKRKPLDGLAKIFGKRKEMKLIHSDICDAEFDFNQIGEDILSILQDRVWGVTQTIVPEIEEETRTYVSKYDEYGYDYDYEDEYDINDTAFPTPGKYVSTKTLEDFWGITKDEIELAKQMGYNLHWEDELNEFIMLDSSHLPAT